MTTPTTLVTVRPDGGYAPDFSVRVSGKPLDEGTHNDIRDIRVVLDNTNMSSFSLTINNWDDRKLRFKYSEQDNEVFDTGNLSFVKQMIKEGLRRPAHSGGRRDHHHDAAVLP